MNYSTKFTESVLDYWFAIEFLSQDNYPNVFEIQNIAKKRKREISEGKASRKSIETFIPLTEEDFDKSILMTKKSIKRSLVKDVLAVYEEYKAEIYNNMKNKTSSEEYSQEMLIRKYEEKIFNICNNVEDLANILISELYDTANNKQFIWAIVGDYLVEKLLKDNNYEIQYPVEDKNGSIEWNGTKYSIIKEGVDELC